MGDLDDLYSNFSLTIHSHNSIFQLLFFSMTG